jgi:hypothetical protein
VPNLETPSVSRRRSGDVPPRPGSENFRIQLGVLRLLTLCCA